MDELHDQFDKLATEVDHLERILARDELPQSTVDLALSVAKRVRRQSVAVVKGLAERRDELSEEQP